MPKRSSSRKRAAKKCALDRAILRDGRCSGKIPCLGPDGGSLPYAKRGLDGHCRVRPCKAGMIRYPNTGRCRSRKTKVGQMTALSKRYDDARRFVSAYDLASQGDPLLYYNNFDPHSLQSQYHNRERMGHGRNIQQRRERADALRWANEDDDDEEGFLDRLKKNVRWATSGVFS